MAESQTVDDDAQWQTIQDAVQAAEDVLRSHYDDDRIVRDDETALVIAAPSDDEHETISEETGVPVARVRELMHERAEALTSWDWGYSYPIVIEQE